MEMSNKIFLKILGLRLFTTFFWYLHFHLTRETKMFQGFPETFLFDQNHL